MWQADTIFGFGVQRPRAKDSSIQHDPIQTSNPARHPLSLKLPVRSPPCGATRTSLKFDSTIPQTPYLFCTTIPYSNYEGPCIRFVLRFSCGVHVRCYTTWSD